MSFSLFPYIWYLQDNKRNDDDKSETGYMQLEGENYKLRTGHATKG